MHTSKYDYKIISGKLRKIPVDDKTSLSQRYSRDGYDSTPIKIGNRYPVVPPISHPTPAYSRHAKPSEEFLAERVRQVLASVPRARLLNIRKRFGLLDADRSGRITTYELRTMLLSNNIFLLDPTLGHLVDKFSADLGGVKYEALCDFLEECHGCSSVGQHQSKLDGFALHSVALTTPLRTQPVSNCATEDTALKAELEKELQRAAQQGLLADIKKLRASFQLLQDREGTIKHREAIRLCPPDRLPISQDLLEKTLQKFAFKHREGLKLLWEEFISFLEPIVARVSIKSPANQMAYSNTQTQTNTAPDPVLVKIRGRNVYVYPPDIADEHISAEEPEQTLQLEWVYGYRGKDCRNNLFVLKSGEVIYFTAAVAVIYNTRDRVQRHYTQHTDDIKSLAVHPDGVTVATGQVAGHDKVQGEPHFRIWNSSTLETNYVIGLGYFERAVIALGFSMTSGVDQGRYIVSVDDNDYHTITVWDWAKNKRIANARGHMDQVLAVSFTPFDVTDSTISMVSCGKQHVSFWTLDEDNKLKCDRGRFDHNVKPSYISCLAFARNGDVITGDTSGNIYVWREGSNQISSAVRNAHEGPVYALLVLPNGDLLSGGGKDSRIRAWKDMKELKPTGVELRLRSFGVTGIRTLAVDQKNTLYIGTTNNCIWTTELSAGKSPLMEAEKPDRLKELVAGHADDLRGLAAHPTSSRFITAGSDKTVRLWDVAGHSAVWTARPPVRDTRDKDKTPVPHAVAFSPTADTIAVGHQDGSFAIFNASTGDLLCFKRKCAHEKISELKFSPGGDSLAVASHDNNIYMLKLLNGGKVVDPYGKCEGHTSFVTHIDWSADGERLQSTSGDYELLFWDPKKCERITSAQDMRNTDWATHNCILGFPVAGIWPEGADGTDINAVDRSHNKLLLATADDFGDVNLFRYPCAMKKARARVAKGHSAHVTCVRFLGDDSRVISVGGRDASIMQWKVVQ